MFISLQQLARTKTKNNKKQFQLRVTSDYRIVFLFKMNLTSDEKVRNAEVLFSFHTKPSTSNTSTTTNTEVDGDTEQLQTEAGPDAIMCVLWKTNRIGTAFYRKNDRQLYIINDVMDQAPHFFLCRSLHKSVNPLHTITLGFMDEAFIKFMIDMRAPNEVMETDEAATVSDAPRTVPPNLTLLPFKEYTFETCKSAVQNISLASYPAGASATEKDVYLHSVVNFDAPLAVYALGALIKFLSSNWLQFEDTEELHFLHINQVSLDNHVLMDGNTYKALQIFSLRSHESTFKKGVSSSSREGLSIYKLFSMHCKSRLGQKALRNIIFYPVNDPIILNKRLNLIEFSIQMNNKTFTETVQDNLKNMEDINVILSRIQHRRATVKNWESLYKTMLRIASVSELCYPHRHLVSIFDEMCNAVAPELHGLIDAIHNAIDFSSHRRTRPVIKFGLDEELDAKKLRRQDIGKHLTAAANFALTQLPQYFTECSVIYVPEMGHLVVVKEQEPDMESNELKELGFQFMFSIKGEAYYKNPMCVELDAQLGELNLEIIAHENRIIERLSGYVLAYNRSIHEPLRFLALTDCLLAMSKVALLNGYVRPTINTQNVHEIQDARHPLLELISSNFHSNNFYSGGNNGKVKILTGPNASGKSVYLKQIALIIFLAHIGSFVPATKANIATVYSIHSRIHATESVTARLSSFMIDLSQMSTAIYNARGSSFITIDEFGRGTTGSEGIAILAGAIKKFLDQNEFCPHVLVSTHLHQVLRYLPDTPQVQALKMQHSIYEEKLVFTYEVVQGVSNSYAVDMARAIGLEEDIVARAREILRCLLENKPLTPLKKGSEQKESDLDVLEIPEPCDA